jgi:hypothetical protein
LFRFGIRSLFVVTALLAVAMGLGVREVHRCYRQQQVLHELAQYGSVATRRKLQKYDWLRSFFGDYTHGTIEYLEIKAMRPIDRLPNLRGLADVEEMDFELLNVPDNVAELGMLPKLHNLGVKLRAQSDLKLENVAVLSEVPQLTFLWLAGATGHDSTIAAINPRSPIRVLRLDSARINEPVLERLAEMKSLVRISLHESALENHDPVLLRLSGAQSIAFFGPQISPQDEQKIRSLWPDREITTGTYADTGEKFVNVRESTDSYRRASFDD